MTQLRVSWYKLIFRQAATDAGFGRNSILYYPEEPEIRTKIVNSSGKSLFNGDFWESTKNKQGV
ncbi:MAG: hypothetical protein CSB48_14210 [Proteobacteria bacterium]|nr:MAG: hypothetical protein CSB48_14210 [Pseudomonadota bacterium]